MVNPIVSEVEQRTMTAELVVLLNSALMVI